ncbi:MAG: SDR family NAD(P)-dependent oxidoreductase [Burkholderiaceae bacterium]
MTGYNAWVSGGTAGIGLSTARKLAERGATVTITGATQHRGDAAAAELRRISPRSRFILSDATDGVSCAAVAAAISRDLGSLDIVVSAGAPPNSQKPAPFAEMTAQQVRAGFDARLFARILPVHAAVPHLQRSGRGSVVMVTTDAARHPTPGESVIGAVGAAIILMTKALARELSRDKVRVNTVALTITSGTPAWGRMFAEPGFAEKIFSKAVSRFPFGRPPHADEVAEAVAFFAGRSSGQITGQTLSVNGGLSYGGW